jgi:hypothetical protein
MKKKSTLNENINVLKKVSNRIPKSINEAINFEGADDDMDYMEPEAGENIEGGAPMDNDLAQEPEAQAAAPVNGESEINVEEFITTMRKNSLKIMAKLSDNPDDSVYQFAKKIFQLADKAHEDEKEGKDINGQVKQQGNVPQQNQVH